MGAGLLGIATALSKLARVLKHPVNRATMPPQRRLNAFAPVKILSAGTIAPAA